MEIRHLKLIKAVAEYKSLTRAASKLFLTQSALSHQVKEIEEEYKTKFFYRINKQMLLTPAGERLLKTARIVLQELEKNNDDLKKLSSNEEGIIRLSTQCYTSYYWLSSSLKQFHSKKPKVEIRIIDEATRKPLDFLEEGKLEIALVNTLNDNPNFIFHPLFEDEVVAVFPKDHPWSNLSYVTAKNFTDQNYITYSPHIEEGQSFKYLFDSSPYLPLRITRIELTEAIIEMVKANLGVTILAKWAITPYLSKNELSSLPLGEDGYKRTWYAATLNTTDTPPYLQDFITSLAENTKKQFVLK